MCHCSVRLFLSRAPGLSGSKPAQRHSKSAAYSKKWSAPQHFFLNLGFPSYADCKTFPQSLIQKLCKQRQVSCVVCTLAAYRTACAGCQPLQGGTTCFLCSSSFFIFALSPHTKAALSTSPKEGPYRPPNNHGGAQLIYESPERADSVSKRLAGSLSNLPFLIHLMRVGRDTKG